MRRFILIMVFILFLSSWLQGSEQKVFTDEVGILDWTKKVIDNPEIVKKYLREAIERKIEKTDQLIIRMKYKNPVALSRGKFEEIYLLAKGVEKKHFRLDKVMFFIKDIQLSMDRLIFKRKIRILNVGKISFKTKILEEDINNFFRHDKKKRKIRSPRVKIRKGGIYLSGKVKWWIFNSSFKLKGKFVIKNEDEIHFVVDRARISFLPLPSGTINAIMRKVNPIYKLDDLPFPVKIKKIYCEEGALYIESD